MIVYVWDIQAIFVVDFFLILPALARSLFFLILIKSYFKLWCLILNQCLFDYLHTKPVVFCVDQFYVPLLRSYDTSAIVEAPCSPQKLSEIRENSSNPRQTPLRMKAVAGPMSPLQVMNLYPAHICSFLSICSFLLISDDFCSFLLK